VWRSVQSTSIFSASEVYHRSTTALRRAMPGPVPVVGEYYITANNNYKTAVAAVPLGFDRGGGFRTERKEK